MGKSYTNIAGGEFKPWVDKQINLRQTKLAQKERDTNTLQFSTNRNSWYRVTSMSKIVDGNPLIAKYGDRIKGGNLANDFVLQGGVIIKSPDNGAILRYGIGKKDLNGESINGSYGGVDIDELGYKPMPGITNLEIGTGGKLGVLQEIKIDFKCHNLAQLEIMETLYMKLGFSVFIEFGHTNYFTNDGKHVDNPLPFNPWKYEKKEDLLKATQDKRVSESGNWGGLLGTVKNFAWEINIDGSYNCKIEVVGAGDILESLRTNQNSEKASGISSEDDVADQEDNVVNEDATDTGGMFGDDQIPYLPSVVANRFSSTFENIIFSLYEFGLVNYEDQKLSAGAVPPPNFITTEGGTKVNKSYVKLLNKCFGNSPYSGLKFRNNGSISPGDKKENINRYFAARGNSYQVMRHHLDGEETAEPPVISSKLFTLFTAGFSDKGESARNVDANDDYDDEGKPMVFITLGHLLAIMNHHCNIFYGNDKKSASPYIKIDYHQDYTFGNTNVTQFSCDPSVCLIPFRDKGGLISTALGDQLKASYKNGGIANDIEVAAATKVATKSNTELIAEQLDFRNFFSIKKKVIGAIALASRAFGNENAAKARKVVKASSALKNVVAKEDDNANKVTAILNEQSPYYDSENPNRGKLMEVLVNCNFITSTLAKLQTPDSNQVSTAQLIDEILKGISKSIGGANDFRLYPDDETNVLRILDDKVNDPSKTKYTELRIFGLGNTVYDYSYSSKISNDLATQIVVSSQAQPEGVNADDFAFSHLNRGIVDRLAPVKMTTDIDPDGNSANTADPSGDSPLTMLANHLYNIYCGMHYNANDVNASINVGLKFVNQLNAKDPVKRGQTLIPLEFSLTMDGITGLIPHSAFIIDKNRLPDSYRIQSGKTKGNPRIAFILHSITHNFSSNKWNTTIKGQTLNIDFEGKENESKFWNFFLDEVDKNTPTAKSPPSNSNNSGGGSTAKGTYAGKGTHGEYFPAGCPNDKGPVDYPRPKFKGFEDYKGIRIYYGKEKIRSKSSKEFKNVKLIIDAAQQIGFNAAGCIGVLCVIAKESSFDAKGESMHYSVERARKIFKDTLNRKLGKGYRDSDLLRYIPKGKGGSGSPQKFAELVYGERGGNKQGEGWEYRGSGFNQLTFKPSYEKANKQRNKMFTPSTNILSNPSLMREPWYSAQIAVTFLADRVTRKQGVDIGNFPDVDSAIVHCAFANSTNAKTIPCDIRAVSLQADTPDNDSTKKRKYYTSKKKGAIYFELSP